jgi:hypothetical protein
MGFGENSCATLRRPLLPLIGSGLGALGFVTDLTGSGDSFQQSPVPSNVERHRLQRAIGPFET